LTSVSSTAKEPMKMPPAHIMLGGGQESVPQVGREAVASAATNLAYDEDTLQVPTWIRRQAD